MLKNCPELDNYNAAQRWYTCTHTVYSLFNDIYNSKCALAAVLLLSLLPFLLPSLLSLFISATSFFQHQYLDLSCAKLFSVIGSENWLFFDTSKIYAEFHDLPPSSWDGVELYRNESSVTALTVVNDVA